MVRAWRLLVLNALGLVLLLFGSACIPTRPPAPTPALTPAPARSPTPSPTASPKPAPPATTSFTLTRDVEYGRGGNLPLLLDIYAPARPVFTPMPAVIFIHGGGWQQGDKFPSQVRGLAQRGFFAASINYRLSGVAPFPAAIEDSKCAIRWLRANASKYNVDPDRIGIWGGSAGGHLVLLAGTADESAGLEGNGGWAGVSSRVQAVCSYYGPSDFVDWQGRNSAGNNPLDARTIFLGGTYTQKPDVYRLASPVNHVTKDDPPLLLVHGELDRTVSIHQSELIYDAYRKLGLDVTFIRVAGAGHGFINPPPPAAPIKPSPAEIEQAVWDFFMRTIGKR